MVKYEVKTRVQALFKLKHLMEENMDKIVELVVIISFVPKKNRCWNTVSAHRKLRPLQ